MNQRKALELALQFCEFLWQDVAMNEYAEEYRNRVEVALRAALAESQDEPVAKVELMTTGGNAGLATRIVEIDDHLRERLRPGQMLYTHPAALAEPQEPFGWVTVHRLSQRFENHADHYQFYPAGQIPYLDNADECHAVYTHPAPVRQPLSDEEIMDLVRDRSIQMRWPSTPLDIARAVERAHEIGVQDE